MDSARFTKPELLALLNEKLAEAKKYDAQVLKNHRARNKKVAAARRVTLRAALKLSDDQLAEMSSWKLLKDSTNCPISEAARIERAIKWLEMDNRKTITVSGGGQFSHIARILDWSPVVYNDTVC